MGLNPIPIAVGPAETVAKYVALYDNIQHSVRCDHDIFLVGVLILGLDCLTDTVCLGEMLQDFGCLFLLVHLLAAQYQFVMTLTEQLDPVDDLIAGVDSQSLRHGEIVPPCSQHLLDRLLTLLHLTAQVVVDLNGGHFVPDKIQAVSADILLAEPVEHFIRNRLATLLFYL